MSNVPAGWYPSPEDPSQVRYWDGTQWTQSTAPAVAPETGAEAVTLPAPVLSPPPAPAAPFAPLAPVAAPASAARTDAAGSKKKWIIGGAIAAGVIVVGSVGAAIGAGGRAEPAADASVAPVVATPTGAPQPTSTPTPPAAPVIEVVDAVAFRAQAGSHLDDMLKDLDDIVTTVNEDGFWRLLSNSGELAFNHGQLEALDVPESVATTWPATLLALDGAQDVLVEAISTQDGPSILAAVETVRAQVEATRAVVNTAQ
ncbi:MULTISPECIES: DUF2510 domain-containing protein [unclassified Microbacterium]|uniref:DUF2510 domain-containing protein n=1 Tax=unclassified Microbacterium TaxID=2609290 RepID=UPI000CFB5805|nr:MULTISPECIES: DUF2510 domain-containing protein [unclassified Microbacterium]